METYRQMVGIRANEKEELELVFVHDEDVETRGFQKIVRNEAY
jgi:hypothetical protein